MKLLIKFKSQKNSQEFVYVFNDCFREYTDVTIARENPKSLLLEMPREWNCFAATCWVAEVLEFCNEELIIDEIEFIQHEAINPKQVN